MSKNEGPDASARVRLLLSQAFPDDAAPAELSVGVVSLVELCQLAMPDPNRIREKLRQAEFEIGNQERAHEVGEVFALDRKIFASQVRNLRHEIYGKYRHDAPVVILLSVGDSDEGKVVFCSSIFRGAIEADAIKAAAHVTQKEPFTGSTAKNSDDKLLRRSFWDVGGKDGIRFLVVSGPQNVEATDLPRAITALNKVAKRS
jgi:hypothetical protein